MINHSNCDHPSTKKDRAACRRAQGALPAGGSGATRRTNTRTAPSTPTPAWDDPNAVGALDESTLDDRIRASRRRPAPSAVKVSKVDPSTL